MGIQRIEEPVAGRGRSIPAGQDNDVHRVEFVLVKPETLPDDALDSVSVDGAPDLFLGDCQAKACLAGFAGSHQDGEVAIGRAFRLGEYPLEISSVQQALALAKCE